jgi:predicted ester cyclase
VSGAATARELVQLVNAELINGRNAGVVDELFEPSFVSHTSGDDLDRDAFKGMIAALLAAFPDASVVTELVLAEGELVAWRSVTSGTQRGEWLGVPATNRAVTWTSINIARVHEGRMREHWASPDLLGLMIQLGCTVTPGRPDESPRSTQSPLPQV